MALIDLAMSPEEAKEQTTDIGENEKYSYGLRIHLDDDALAKLGLTTSPEIGSKMMITCAVEVCSKSMYQDQSGEAESSLDLQITAMEIGQSQSSGNAATLLYGGGDE